jgi:hypothetical protein
MFYHSKRRSLVSCYQIHIHPTDLFPNLERAHEGINKARSKAEAQ